MSLHIQLQRCFELVLTPDGAIDQWPDITLAPEPGAEVVVEQCSIICGRLHEDGAAIDYLDPAAAVIMSAFRDINQAVPLRASRSLLRSQERRILPRIVLENEVFRLTVEATYTLAEDDELRTAVAQWLLRFVRSPKVQESASPPEAALPDAERPGASAIPPGSLSLIRLALSGQFLDEDRTISAHVPEGQKVGNVQWSFRVPKMLSEEAREQLLLALGESWKTTPNTAPGGRRELGQWRLVIRDELKRELIPAMRLPVQVRAKIGDNESNWQPLSLQFRPPPDPGEEMRRKFVQFLLRDCRRFVPDQRDIAKFLSLWEKAESSSDAAVQRWRQAYQPLYLLFMKRRAVLTNLLQAFSGIEENVIGPLDDKLSRRRLWIFKRNSATVRLESSIIARIRDALRSPELQAIKNLELSTLSRRAEEHMAQFEDGLSDFLSILKRFPWADTLREFAEDTRVYWQSLVDSLKSWRETFGEHFDYLMHAFSWIQQHILPLKGDSRRLGRDVRQEFEVHRQHIGNCLRWWQEHGFADFECVEAAYSLRRFPRSESTGIESQESN